MDDNLVPTIRLEYTSASPLKSQQEQYQSNVYSHFAPSRPGMTHVVQAKTFHALPRFPLYNLIFSGPFHFANPWSLSVMLRAFHRCTLPGGQLVFQSYLLDHSQNTKNGWMVQEREMYLRLIDTIYGHTDHLTLSLQQYLLALVSTKWQLVACSTDLPCVWNDDPVSLINRWTGGEGCWMRHRYGEKMWQSYYLYLTWTCDLVQRHLLLPVQFKATALA